MYANNPNVVAALHQAATMLQQAALLISTSSQPGFDPNRGYGQPFREGAFTNPQNTRDPQGPYNPQYGPNAQYVSIYDTQLAELTRLLEKFVVKNQSALPAVQQILGKLTALRNDYPVFVAQNMALYIALARLLAEDDLSVTRSPVVVQRVGMTTTIEDVLKHKRTGRFWVLGDNSTHTSDVLSALIQLTIDSMS